MTSETEWSARGYATVSGLQSSMADEVLALIHLNGDEHVLDVGCGDGKITARIASRVPHGSVLGVDASEQMVTYASTRFGVDSYPNLRFRTADARRLNFHREFDLVVSMNALHWIPDQDAALRSIVGALKPDGLAQLRLVPKGPRKSLEDVIEETRLSPRWSSYFQDFHDPYLHVTPEEYAAIAERSGLKVVEVKKTSKSWDFGSRAAFAAFGSVTFVAWTRLLPEAERFAFVNDVLDGYSQVSTSSGGSESTFLFYQMDVRATLRSRTSVGV